jgi:hypothetical protein
VLDPGDYYLLVSDSAGVPTRYALCMALGATCTLPPPPTAASVTAASVTATVTGAPLAPPPTAAMTAVSSRPLYDARARTARAKRTGVRR